MNIEIDKTLIESIAGVWFYHLASDSKPLCGSTNPVMKTEIPAKTWGLKTHINEKYCSKCDEIRSSMKIELL